MKTNSIIKQLGISIGILLVVFVIGTFIQITMFALGFSPIIAFMISAVFVAPLTEEAGKYFSIKAQSTGMYFLIFNFTEFSLYFMKLLNAGVAIPVIIIARLLAVMMHYITTTTQFAARKRDKAGRGYLVATTIHALWNLFATLPLLRQI